MSKSHPKLVDAVEVKVHPTIAGAANKGTRRRAGLTFGVHPTYLSEADLPEAVAKDRHLVKRKAQVEPSKLTQVPSISTAEPKPGSKPPALSQGELTPAQQAEVEAIRKAVENVGPKTAETLVRAGHGLEDTRAWASIRHLSVEQLQEIGLQPAQVKAIAAWQAGLAPELTEKLKAERIQ